MSERRGSAIARLRVAVAVAAAAMLLAGCTASPSPSPTPTATKALSIVRVDAFMGAAGNLLQQVAAGAGAGRTVQWYQVTDSGTAYSSLSNGAADAALVSTVLPAGYTPASGGKKVVVVGSVFKTADAFYSKKVKKLSDLADGATVVLPAASGDLARALKLLVGADLITLTPGETGVKSIATNAKDLVFSTATAAKLAPALSSHGAVFLTANEAISGLVPATSAVLIEPAADMTTNQLITTSASRKDPAVTKLYASLTSSATKAYINTHWKGIVTPVTD